jgi:catechol 2,3-dioxygenase-like lactoylglutathione lyase family enzyme
MATVSVRYIVDNVDEAISFYCEHLGFTEQMHPAPTFAMLSRGDLRLVFSAPSPGAGAGAASSCLTGRDPSQGGGTGSWSRSMTSTVRPRLFRRRALASAAPISKVSGAGS